MIAATDDCTLVLRHVPGARIVAVDGDEVNLKITTRTDMVLADRMIQMRTVSATANPEPVRSIAGSRVYVVGGTSGIGAAIADAARAAGAKVAVDGRSTGLGRRPARYACHRVGRGRAYRVPRTVDSAS